MHVKFCTLSHTFPPYVCHTLSITWSVILTVLYYSTLDFISWYDFNILYHLELYFYYYVVLCTILRYMEFHGVIVYLLPKIRNMP